MLAREERVLLETRLRNLKRKYAKLIQHSDLNDVAADLKTEIDELQTRLQ